MKLALLTGCAAALTLFGAAAAQAEIVYSSDPGYVATDPGYVAADTNVIATTPGSVVAVPAPPFGPFTPRYIVTQPTVVVAPQAAAPERVIERERVIVAPSKRSTARRERVIERERVVVAPERRVVVESPAVVAPRASGIITTGSSNGCFIDLNGFERCY
jgi:hypothetical protein